MIVLRLLVIGAAVLVLALGDVAGTRGPGVEAAFPGENGKIAFYSTRPAAQQEALWVMDADGSNLRFLRSVEGSAAGLAWSADGGQLAFESADGTSGFGFDIYIGDFDGSELTNVRNVTSRADHDRTPAFSPDGREIAFSSPVGFRSEIFVTNVDGTGTPRQLTTEGGVWPSWSPDGSTIAYARDGGLSLMNSDGTNHRTLTTGVDREPDWSPDGESIAFTRVVGTDWFIFAVDLANPGSPRQITNSTGFPNGAGDEHPTWSPDGRQIAFGTRRSHSEIWVVNVDGSNLHRLTTFTQFGSGGGSVDHLPAWQPLAGECPGTAAASVFPQGASTDDDTDGDNIPDNIENNITNTDPNCQDTDGDGLLDPWEVEGSVEGAGFDLDGDGDIEVTRDEVFGPYAGQCGSQINGVRFEPLGQNCGLVGAPNPLHKDVYIEMDWQDCWLGNCPEFLGVPGSDPSHHAPNMAGLLDVVNVFRSAPVENPDDEDGVNLHILVDEAISHFHNCDRGASAARAESFGTVDQRDFNADATRVLQAKEMVYRYAWSGHSSLEDYDPARCLLPSQSDLLLSSAGLAPLPYYDDSPFGDATFRGRDILVTLAISWVCQLYSFDVIPAVLGQLPPCFRKITGPLTAIAPGLFPADIALENGGSKELELPMHMTLGIPPADGVRQLWGRGFANLLGTSLGVSPGALGNEPTTTGAQPVNSFGSWSGLLYAPPQPGSSPSGGSSGQPEPVFPDYALAQHDQDGDGVPEVDDTCPGINAAQDDLDADGLGDACDNDADADGTLDEDDDNPSDTDNDSTPNGSDGDDDEDAIADMDDNCPLVQNNSQENVDGDAAGDTCDGDIDGDGLPNFVEQFVGSDASDASALPEFFDYGVSCSDGEDNDGDGDMDGADDGCQDADGDTVPNSLDNCPGIDALNVDDTDNDGTGDACEPVGDPRVWGDNDCNGAITSRDGQALSRLVLAQAPLSQTQPCPAVGSMVTVDGVGERPWGDIDCNGTVAARDGQALLRNVLGQPPLSQTQPCPAIGETVGVVGAALVRRVWW
jgi:Tol biopolymer transport system component